MKDKIFRTVPHFFQELMVSLFNFKAYKVRYGEKYKECRKILFQNRKLRRIELENLQSEKFDRFLSFAKENTVHYSDISLVKLADIDQLQILSKEELRKSTADFFTVSKKQGLASKTGGTTGKSLEVLYTSDNAQERFAMLDDFRSRFGYELGKKTAWFSGKNLLSNSDINKNRFWKTDHFHNVRYYSTFHISEKYLKFYIENLVKFKPEYLVGFPSTMLEIAKFGLLHNYQFPENTIKAIFPTAESINEIMRSTIEKFFKCKMYNQYASSEGAPFIIECEKGKLHMELQSGIFEVLDNNNKPTKSGKLVITSFTTEGTPLIRYDIGDSITLEDPDDICTCGNHNPLVKEILGRIDDYIYSPENGKINLGNISNTLKGTKGIVKFQVIQDKLDEITILIIKEEFIYTLEVEEIFLNNWKDRLGKKMKINIKYVNVIDVEASGKYRMVKNNIKHLLDA